MELDSAVTKVFGAYGVDDDPDGQDIPIDELIGSVNGWSVGIGCYGRLLVVENPAAGRRWSGVLGDGYDAQGNKIASVLTAGLDGNSIGVLVNCRGRIYSKSGGFEAVLKFLKSKAQESEAL